MFWRLTLDVPLSFPTERGFVKAVHCAEFRPLAGSLTDAMREEKTSLVFLEPKWKRRDYNTDFKPLTDWRIKETFWKEIKRSQDLTAFYSMVRPAGTAHNLIEILCDTAIVAIDANESLKDNLKWALESKFFLKPDEGFSLEYHGLNDEVIRKNNWMYIQWGNIGVHFSYRGVARVYLYPDRNDLTSPPDLLHEFTFANPQEILHRTAYLRFLPIPSLGLLFYHQTPPPSNNLVSPNVDAGFRHGHLIPFPSFKGTDGIARMFDQSLVRIAVNPYQPFIPSFGKISFPLTGSYTDAVRDPGYVPSALPALYGPVVLETLKQTASCELRKGDDSGAWVAGTDRQFRMKTTLTTDDASYTPFVYGYETRWDPVHTTRATTPVATTILKLEITDGEQATFEGHATCLVEGSAAMRIAERADATFLLERSEDGSAWSTHAGGLALDWELEPIKTGAYPLCYLADMRLADFNALLDETELGLESSFDNVSVGDCLNAVLVSRGFAPISPLPLTAQTTKLPPSVDGQAHRFAPGPTDKGRAVVDKLLLFLRRQDEEWLASYDWSTQAWVITQKPRDTSAGARWQLTVNSDLENIGARVVRYGPKSKFKPEPPEANAVLAIGTKTPDSQSVNVKSWLCKNVPSFSDTSSKDYLGRVKLARYYFKEVADPLEIRKMARRVYDAVAHRRMMGEPVMIPVGPQGITAALLAGITPNRCVDVLDDASATLFTAWVKRRTINVVAGLPNGFFEDMTIKLDESWAGEIRCAV